MTERFDPVAFLAAVGVLAARDGAETGTLAGGYWNAVYRVRRGGDDLVVKHFGGTPVASTLFPIMPETEARALQVLAGRGVAPDPVGFWPAADGHGPVLVYRFVPGDTWRGDMAEAAALMRRMHDVPPEGFRPMPVTSQEVLAHADTLPPVPADDPAWRRLCAVRPKPSAVPPLARRTLIHADFSAGNMIAGPHGALAIDWQCPGAGDPAEDLWSFLALCFQLVYGREPWSAGEVAACRAAYGDAEVLARLDAMTPFSRTATPPTSCSAVTSWPASTMWAPSATAAARRPRRPGSWPVSPQPLRSGRSCASRPPCWPARRGRRWRGASGWRPPNG